MMKGMYRPSEDYSKEELDQLAEYAQSELDKLLRTRLGRKVAHKEVILDFYPDIYDAELDTSGEEPVIGVGLGTPKSEIKRSIKHEIEHLAAEHWDRYGGLTPVSESSDLENLVVSELKTESLRLGGDRHIKSSTLVNLTEFLEMRCGIPLEEAWEEVRRCATYYFKISNEVRKKAEWKLFGGKEEGDNYG